MPGKIAASVRAASRNLCRDLSGMRFGAPREKQTSGPRLTPAGDPIPGRSSQHPHMKDNVTFIENAFLE